jgi:hypothetical protein
MFQISEQKPKRPMPAAGMMRETLKIHEAFNKARSRRLVKTRALFLAPS